MKRSLFFSISLCALVACSAPETGVVVLAPAWEVSNDSMHAPAQVPGHVLLDLQRAGHVPDAFWGTYEEDVQWVEDQQWSYSCTFETPISWNPQDSTFLEFQGLDTYASVWLDGQLVLEADNAHRTWRTALFAAGSRDHELVVTFMPVAVAGAERLANHDFPVPCSNENRPIGKQTSPYTRKAAYQFGWDWGPRLAGPGITHAVNWINRDLRGTDDSSVPWCEVLSALPNEARVLVHNHGEWTLSCESPHHWVGDTLIWENPSRWWPNGLGEPHLQQLSWTHQSSGAQHQHALGLRTIEWRQETDAYGTSFQAVINGVPLQARGANVVPPDFFPSRAADRWGELVNQAVAANMNMIRVWGGGGYPPEAFYHACDEAGLLVWQDFAFACSMIPGNQAFQQNVLLEAEEQVKRLRHHACIALWCGNNESELAWDRWGWQDAYDLHGPDSVKAWGAYSALFENQLPALVEQHSPSFYWPSSPHGEPNSGDEHAWGIWFGLEDFDYYSSHSGRFASEYGLQSLPDKHTLKEAGIEHFTDRALQFRQRSKMDWLEPGFDGWDMMMHFMKKTVGAPQTNDLEDWIFRSQATQAEGLRQALERHRTSNGRIAGSLYWSLNDVWPAVSWSTIDHAGRWKLGHYAAQRANAPQALIWQRERQDSLVFLLVNESMDPIEGAMTLSLNLPDGHAVKVKSRPIRAGHQSNTAINFGPINDWNSDPLHTYLSWSANGSQSTLNGTALWTSPVAFAQPPTFPSISIAGSNLTLVTSHYEPIAFLTADVPGHFTNNGMSLSPGDTCQIQFIPETEAQASSYTLQTMHSKKTLKAETTQPMP